MGQPEHFSQFFLNTIVRNCLCKSHKLHILEGLNAVNRLATNGEKYNGLPTKREKKLPTAHTEKS